MKRLDDFVEFGTEGSLGSIVDARRPNPGPNDEEIVRYLRSGLIVLDVMERQPDVVDGSYVEQTGSLCTDGRWYWREDLAHYVERHHVRLSCEFVGDLRERDFAVVVLTRDQVVDAMRRIVEDWS